MWYKSKTNWTCIIAAVTAVGAYLSGEITLVVAVQTIFASLVGIFLRQGVEKSGPQA
jgi:hypothetical protein